MTREDLVLILDRAGWRRSSAFAARSDLRLDWSPVAPTDKVLELLQTRAGYKLKTAQPVGDLLRVIAALEAVEGTVIIAYLYGEDETRWVYLRNSAEHEPIGALCFVRVPPEGRWGLVAAEDCDPDGSSPIPQNA